ncbi:MAG: DUF3558 family protein, partial [Pseudonocardiaceae bacterium]
SLFTRSVLLPLLAAGVLGVGACSEEPGTAEPTPGTATGQPSGTTTERPGQGSASLAIDPCSLLDTGTLEKMFSGFVPFKDGDASDSAGARGCTWYPDRETASDPGIRVDVGVRDSQGVREARDAGGGVEMGDVQGRPAARVPIPPSGCIIALAVGENSRVDIIVGEHDRACDFAGQVADIVEPKLPKG